MNLAIGSRGDAVRSLQQALNAHGLGPLQVDGIYGALTREAVQQFQSSAGLSTDGIAGDRTLAALGLTDSAQAESQVQPLPGEKKSGGGYGWWLGYGLAAALGWNYWRNRSKRS